MIVLLLSWLFCNRREIVCEKCNKHERSIKLKKFEFGKPIFVCKSCYQQSHNRYILEPALLNEKAMEKVMNSNWSFLHYAVLVESFIYFVFVLGRTAQQESTVSRNTILDNLIYTVLFGVLVNILIVISKKVYFKVRKNKLVDESLSRMNSNPDYAKFVLCYQECMKKSPYSKIRRLIEKRNELEEQKEILWSCVKI